MSISSQKLATDSSQNGASPSSKFATKRKRPPYQHYMGTNAKVAVEEAMRKAAVIQEHVRRLLKWQDEADAEMLELQNEIAAMSKLDHRVPIWENKVLRVRLRIKELARIASDIAVESAEIERALSHTLATARELGPLPGARKREGEDGEGNGGQDDSQQQTRGGP